MVPSNSPPLTPDQARQQFLLAHPDRGTLRVQVSTARGTFPVPEAAVTVTRSFAGTPLILYRGVTDISGILDNLSLPALPDSYSQNPSTARQSGTDYQVSVYHPDFVPVNVRPVTIFSNIETILPVVLEPITRM